MAIKPLTATQVDEVLDRFGFSSRPPADLDGLTEIYRTWCRRVPFDNLRKLVALHYRLPEIPGIDPADFFAVWQLTGAGSTCWGSNNALHALLVGLGFDARLHAAAMFDGETNHATTIVHLGDEEWLVDTAMHTDAPLPLVEGQPASVAHRGYVTSVRPDPAGWMIEFPTPDPSFFLPCRLRGEMDHAATVAGNEKSREWSPFNTGIMAQINDQDGVWLLNDETLSRIDPSGSSQRRLTAPEVDAFLVEVTGHSPQLVAEVRAVLVAQAEAVDEG